MNKDNCEFLNIFWDLGNYLKFMGIFLIKFVEKYLNFDCKKGL